MGQASNDLGFVSTPPASPRLDAEVRAVEAARRAALVAAQRDAVVARAHKLGYRVTESREGDQVRLVLVERTY